MGTSFFRISLVVLGTILNSEGRAAPIADKTGTAPSVLSMPAGPGSIEGLGKGFQPNLNTGSTSYKIAIELPQGPAGLQPEVLLKHNSGMGNSTLGYGWSLSVGLSIERQFSKGFPKYRDSDRGQELRDVFEFQGEELVPLSDGSYRLKNEDQFRRFWPISSVKGGPLVAWLVEDKDGTRHWLGRYSIENADRRSSRIVNPLLDATEGRSEFERVFQWLEDATEDVNGNRIEYEYSAEPESSGILYLERIRYFGRGLSTNFHEVQLFRESRPDRLSDHQSGFARSISHRYREISVGSFYGGRRHVVRGYTLSYRPSDGVLGKILDALPAESKPVDIGATRLRAITKFGSDRDWGGSRNAGTELPSTRMSYVELFLKPMPDEYRAALAALSQGLMPFEKDPLTAGPQNGKLLQLSTGVDGDRSDRFDLTLADSAVQFVDVNGDGLPDILDSRRTPQKPTVTVALNKGDDLFTKSVSITFPDGVDLGWSSPGKNEVALADMGGRGLADLIHVEGSGPSKVTRTFSNIRINQVSPLGFDPTPRPEGYTPPELSISDSNSRFADIDFDKRPDVLITDEVGIRAFRSNESNGWDTLGSVPWDTIGAGASGYRFSIRSGGSLVPNPLVQLLDANGDRLPDLVRVIPRLPGVAEVRYRPLIGPMTWGKEVALEFALGDGTPSGQPAELQLAGLTTDYGPSWNSVRFVDVNGDGLTDIVHVGKNRSISVFLNCHGRALSGPHVIANAPIYDPDSSTDPTILRALDVNGNGSTDLVYYHAEGDEERRGLNYLDFMSGQKPGLLQILDNGIGLRSVLRHSPSTEDLVRADRAGAPWLAVSPIPTWVVSAIIESTGLDLNGDGQSDYSATTFQYRDPYYDGSQKQFRGFAFVQMTEWGDDIDHDRLPQAAPAVGRQATLISRYRFHTGAPDLADNDEYVVGVDVEPRPIPITVDEQSIRGGNEEEPLFGRLIFKETAHGVLLRNTHADFDQCALQTALAALRLGPFHADALRCTPNSYVYERQIDHWSIRRIYRGAGAVAPKARLIRRFAEVVQSSSLSVTFPVLRKRVVERFEANELLQKTFSSSLAPFAALPPVVLQTEFDYDDFGNMTAKKVLAVDENGRATPKNDQLTLSEYIVPMDANKKLTHWILDRIAVQRVQDGDGNFIHEERSYYDGSDFVGLPGGQIGERGLVTRRAVRVSDTTSPVAPLERRPNSAQDVDWIGAPGDPRPGALEWMDVDRLGRDALGNIVTRLDGEAIVGAGGRPSETVGHFTVTRFEPEFLTLPVQELRFAGAQQLPIVFNAEYSSVGSVYNADISIGFGVITGYIDPNGNRTSYQYDVHGRLTAVVRPGGVVERPSTIFRYAHGNPHQGVVYTYDRRGSLAIKSVDPRSAANSVRTDLSRGIGADVSSQIQFTSGRGQKLLRLESSADIGVFDAVESGRFSARGAQIFKSQPYRQNGFEFEAVPHDASGSSLALDPIGRTIMTELPRASSTEPNQETRTHYGPLSQYYFDAEDLNQSNTIGTPLVSQFNGFGRLSRVSEIVRGQKGVETWTTRYGYNGQGRNVWILDSSNNLRWTRFDGLGRCIAHHDANRGPDIFSYDRAGNLLQSFDKKQQKITYSYDGINRLISEKYSNIGAVADVSYTYDRAVSVDVNGTPATTRNTIGFLSWVSDASGEEYFSFDARGQIEWNVKKIFVPDSAKWETFRFGREYDSGGRLSRLSFPDGAVFDHSYDAGGHLARIENNGAAIVAEQSYTAAGHRERTTFGNGVITDRRYDAQQRPLSLLTSTLGGSQIINLQYAYDGASNIASILDGRSITQVPLDDPRRSDQRFSYDDVYRLTSVQYPKLKLTFSYDAIGNLTERNARPDPPLGNPSKIARKYGGLSGATDRIARDGGEAGPHAITSDSEGAAYSYDGNGNLEQIGTTKFAWDAKDRLIASENGAQRAEYSYDYSNRRVRKSVRQMGARAPPTQFFYPDRSFEIADGESLRYAFDGPLAVARVSNKGHLFFHHDHLGSVSAITDNAGRVIEELSFYPFGDIRNRDGARAKTLPMYDFIQKERDSETGLLLFDARFLSSEIGRFTKVDPLFSSLPIEAFSNPQALNGYAYAANNPIKYRDASGKWIETAWDVVSLGLSVKAVREDPSVGNIAAVIVDAAAVALPFVPAGMGAVRAASKVVHEGDIAAAAASNAVRVVNEALDVGKVGAKTAKSAESIVYRSVNAAGETAYVGITKDLGARASQHLAQKGIEIRVIPGLSGLARGDARAVEQVLIEHHGLEKYGGSLMNKINSISASNPIYAESVKKGAELLKQVGYPGF